MLIKTKQFDSNAWPRGPTTSSSLSGKTIPLKKHHDHDDDWPPLPCYDDDDSGCSFASAPSYFSDDDDEEDEEKGKGGKDTKVPTTTATTIPTRHAQQNRYFFHIMPTTVEARHESRSGSNMIPSHEMKHNKDGDEASTSTNNNSNNNGTSELLQIGSMVVVGLVGLLVVFVVGVAVGEHGRRDHYDWDDHSYSHWEAPRRLTGHRRQHFRDW